MEVLMPRSTQDFDFTQLSVDERTLLAHRLWESVQHEVEAMPLSAEQRAEVERRVADADAGRMTFVPWEAVKLRLKNRK
jgi:putative addiction module component (TIGR02574 family)